MFGQLMSFLELLIYNILWLHLADVSISNFDTIIQFAIFTNLALFVCLLLAPTAFVVAPHEVVSQV